MKKSTRCYFNFFGTRASSRPAASQARAEKTPCYFDKAILLFFLLSCQILSAGQDDQTKVRRLWGNFGAGILEPLEEPAGPGFFVETEPAILLSMSYQRDLHVFTLRYMVTTLLGVGLACEGLGDCTKYKDFSLLYGLATRWRKAHASISVGPGLTSLQDGLDLDENGNFISDEHGNPANRTVKRLGLALGTQLFWRPIESVGFGIYGFGNINSERHLFGAMVSFQFLFF